MSKAVLNQSIIAGIISAIIYGAFSFGTYYTSVNSYVSFSYIYALLPVIMILLIVMGFRIRKQFGGYLSFKEVLQFAFMAYVIYEIVVAITTYLLFVVIDPQLTRKMLDITMKYTADMMKRFGAPQTQIDDAIAKSHKQQETTGNKNILLGIGINLVWDFIKSLLVAVIVKKERPADLDFTPQTTL